MRVKFRGRVTALTLNHLSPSPSPGPNPNQYALGRSMVFFRLGAAAALLALDDIDNDAALRQTLRDTISAFARLGLGLGLGFPVWVRLRVGVRVQIRVRR